MFQGMFITGWLIILYCIFFQAHFIRIEWDKVAKFSAFLFVMAAARFALLSHAPIEGYMPGFERICFVPWEDAFFSAFGITFFKDYLKFPKKFWIPIAIAFSVIFATGHLAYSVQWAIITLFFPYFISYRYGKKYGYGTMMMCHILYDFSTLLTVKLVKVISILG